jgi:hypothetical protein
MESEVSDSTLVHRRAHHSIGGSILNKDDELPIGKLLEIKCDKQLVEQLCLKLDVFGDNDDEAYEAIRKYVWQRFAGDTSDLERLRLMGRLVGARKSMKMTKSLGTNR